MNIVLYEPEIPSNTGNIARTCAVTGCSLHLIGPLGFQITDASLKRAGLDYWHLLDVRIYSGWNDFVSKNDGVFWLYSTKGIKNYCDVSYGRDDYLVFGKETAGLPDGLRSRYEDSLLRIPMRPGIRSLNLSNAAAIVAYEAFRQLNFQF